MTKFYKIIPIRESLYRDLKKCSELLGLTVDEYVEVLIANTHTYLIDIK